MKNIKQLAFKLDAEIVDKFKDLSHKTGYKQVYLIDKALREIIKTLEQELANGK